MRGELKRQILQNEFVYRLRREKIADHQAYECLCNALRELAVDWRDASVVDKEVVDVLYVLPRVIDGAAASLAERQPELAQQLEGMALTVDNLVLDCLSSRLQSAVS
jgi:hypothetical protein